MKTLTFGSPPKDKFEEHLLYNGGDCITEGIVQREQMEEMTPNQKQYYFALMALMEPLMAAEFRGIKLNEEKRLKGIEEVSKEIVQSSKDIVEYFFKELGWTIRWTGKDFSRKDLQHLFFNEPGLEPCPACGWTGIEDTGEIYKTGKRKGKPKLRKCQLEHQYRGYGILATKTKKGGLSLDEKALERIVRLHGEDSAPGWAATLILQVRHLLKERQLLQSYLPDGRWRSQYIIGGAATSRLAGKKDNRGRGGNPQNFNTKRKGVLEADEGYTLVKYDWKTAESHMLAVTANDRAYIEAHEGEWDTHTFVGKLLLPKILPDLDFPEDPKEALAWVKGESFSKLLDLPVKLPRDTVRDGMKVLQHAWGRKGTYRTMADTLRLRPRVLAQPLKRAIDETFPDTTEFMDTLEKRHERDPSFEIMGVTRTFYGRPGHDTVKKILAHILQMPVSLATLVTLWRVWDQLDDKYLEPGKGRVQFLQTVHDSCVFQVKDGWVEWFIGKLKPLLDVQLFTLDDHPIKLVYDLEVGKNLKDMKGVG